jgi:predicted lipid-binding transport protein (Tim44 family)
MSEGIPYADILILALIAGFILLRLRSVLGSKSGNDNPGYFNRPTAVEDDRDEPIVQVEDRSFKVKPREEDDAYLAKLNDKAIADTINAIKTKDPQFTAIRFLQGARDAYEMVFDAFAKGDKQTLKMLLSDPIYAEFSREIDARDKEENKTETTLVSVKPKEITEARLTGNVARLKVMFSAEQVTLVRNSKGDIVEGDVSAINHVEEDWVFERDISSKNPNWKVIET